MSHIPRNQPIQFADCLLPPAPPEETVVRKVWGWERWLTNQDLYCGKLLLVIPGFYCSVHRHQVQDETFVLWAGLLCLEFWGTPDGADGSTGLLPQQTQEFRLKPGDPGRVPTGTWHRFWAPCEAVVLEISTHHRDSDSERFPGHESGPIED